ncbi:MAG: hypothetical protein J6K22_08235 [Spirochaetaceae bacterium]|nr:hypothetical protein [Spirochaetaceae bacterium]
MKMLKINENQEELNCGDVVFYEETGWQGDGLYCVQIAGTELVSRLFLTATGFAFATANLMPLTTVTILGKIKGVLIPTISLGGGGINKACFFKSFLVPIFMLIFIIIGELTDDTSSRKLSNSC